jgi:hypothetical protein
MEIGGVLGGSSSSILFIKPESPVVSEASVLGRLSQNPDAILSPVQAEADTLVEHFIDNATDWRSIAALTVGGWAYRWGKTAALSSQLSVLSRGNLLSSLFRMGSVALGLASEVTAFEFTNRFLTNLQGTGRLPLQENPNLWSFSGYGGWKEGWILSLINFAALKGFGRFTEGQNLLLRHASQDLGMILGHHLTYGLGLEEKPQGSLGEQWARAEAVNLQFGLANGLLHKITGGKLSALERSNDLAQSKFNLRWPPQEIRLRGFEPIVAREPSPFHSPRIWAMAEMQGGGGGGAKKPGVAELNELILNGDLKAIGEAEVYYVIPQESIGGYAGTKKIAVNAWFEAESGKIVAIGNPQDIPEEVSKNRREITFLIKVSIFDEIRNPNEPSHSIVKIFFDSKGIDPKIAELFDLLQGKPFQSLHSDLADTFGLFDARKIEKVDPLPGQETIVIGRGPSADLRLEDPFVSRIHATFREEADGNWKIYDGSLEKKSKQGVFLATPEGWVRLKNPTLLQEGNILGIVSSEGFKLYRWQLSSPVRGE